PAVIKRVVETFPHRTRNWILDEWLPRYLVTSDRGQLELANRIAKVREDAGDTFLRDFIAGISASPIEGDLAQGIGAFEAGRNAGDKRDIAGAAMAFARAAAFLRAASSPLALIAGTMAATNEFYAGKSTDALARLDAVDADLASRRGGYPFIATQASIAQRINDAMLLAETGAVRALALRDLARYDEASRTIAGARAIAQTVPTPALRDRITSDLAYVASTMPTIHSEESVAI